MIWSLKKSHLFGRFSGQNLITLVQERLLKNLFEVKNSIPFFFGLIENCFVRYDDEHLRESFEFHCSAIKALIVPIVKWIERKFILHLKLIFLHFSFSKYDSINIYLLILGKLYIMKVKQPLHPVFYKWLQREKPQN